MQNFLSKIGALDPSNNRNKCLEILDAAGASSHLAWQGLIIHVDFSCLNLMFSWLLRIIVDIIVKSVSLGHLSWVSGEQKIEFSNVGLVFLYIQTHNLDCLTWLAGYMIKEENPLAWSSSFYLCILAHDWVLTPKLKAKQKPAGQNTSQQDLSR